MLRILHTADWHLGQSFHGFDRDFEHAAFLEWLRRILAERQVDVLLVAGDIFDSVNPSATAQRRFYNFLAEASAARPTLQIVITAGNHDAAARLEAPAALLESLRITVVGTVAREESGAIDVGRFLVPLRDASGRIAALALAIPFLRPADVPEVPEATDAYLDGIREVYRAATDAACARRVREAPGAPLIALGHCHLQQAAESRDSERRIIIGGAEALSADTFPPELAYVALGHLHLPQQLDGGRIRYSGSPIPLSFSEITYAHRVLEITIDDDSALTVESLPIPKTVALVRLPARAAAPLPEVLRLIGETSFDAALPAAAQPLLEVRVLDDGPDPTRRRQIEQALEGKAVRLALIRLERLARTEEAADAAVTAPTLADLSSLDPEEIMISAHRERYGSEPDPRLLVALREVLAGLAHATSATE